MIPPAVDSLGSRLGLANLNRPAQWEGMLDLNGDGGCWLWLGVTRLGYGRLHLPGVGKVTAHRAFYEAFVGRIPKGLQLDHLCRVRHCVNPEHLEPVTPLENSRRSGATKLTAQQVDDILRRPGDTYAALAREFDVTEGTIGMIRNGQTWADRKAAIR